MIVSLKRKFIFIHNPKTGGSSVRRALAPYDEGRELKARTKHETITSFKRRNKLKLNDFFTFGFIRHPLDRFCSFYHFLKKHPDKFPEILTVIDVNDFATRLEEDWLKDRYSLQPQHTYFNNDTTIYRFERLAQDFELLTTKLNISTTLDHTNKSTTHSYEDLLNDDTKVKLFELYKQDFKQFNYENKTRKI